KLGLRSSDLIRLHRRWSRAIAADPGIAVQAKDILQEDPGELPIPRPGTIEAVEIAAPDLPTLPPIAAAKAEEAAEPEPDEAPPLLMPLPHEIAAAAEA